MILDGAAFLILWAIGPAIVSAWAAYSPQIITNHCRRTVDNGDKSEDNAHATKGVTLNVHAHHRLT